MIKPESGFTMVELLVAMVMFLLVITAASNVFTPVLMQSKQQSKITETNIEGIVGLDILRRDIEHAGYGLPWDLNGVAYSEADNALNPTPQDEEWYNDSPNNPPRALVSGNGDGDGTQGGTESDVLVIKSLIVATSEASQKWTHVNQSNILSEWIPSGERLTTNDRVIIMVPGEVRTLVNDGSGVFTARYDATTEFASDMLLQLDGTTALGTALLPVDVEDTYVVYGVTLPASPVTGNLRMPFNRADYYVRTPLPANFPIRCAAGTGILYKGTLNQGDDPAINGGGLNELPLIDCVADMQVIYGVDMDMDGDFDPVPTTDQYFADFSGTLLTAEDVRRVKQVRVYILAHEGQRNPNFTFTNFTCAGRCITVGEFGLGRDFDLTAVTDWPNYRWKVYTLVVKVED